MKWLTLFAAVALLALAGCGDTLNVNNPNAPIFGAYVGGATFYEVGDPSDANDDVVIFIRLEILIASDVVQVRVDGLARTADVEHLTPNALAFAVTVPSSAGQERYVFDLELVGDNLDGPCYAVLGRLPGFAATSRGTRSPTEVF